MWTEIDQMDQNTMLMWFNKNITIINTILQLLHISHKNEVDKF